MAKQRSTQTSISRTDVLGVGISAVNLTSATDSVIDWIRRREKHYVAVTGVHGVIEAQDDPAFKRILNGAGLNVPDGVPMVWLSRLAGHTHVSRVFGPDFMMSVSAALSNAGGRVFYYGGAPGVGHELARSLKEHYPGLQTAGVYSPPFRDLTVEEEEQVIEAINRSAADIVWVGLSTPKQERWMERFRADLNAPVLIGVGAAFDYHTGKLKTAPSWMQRSGLEWFFRLAQEPRRLWKRYARNNPLFIYYLICRFLKLRNFHQE